MQSQTCEKTTLGFRQYILDFPKTVCSWRVRMGLQKSYAIVNSCEASAKQEVQDRLLHALGKDNELNVRLRQGHLIHPIFALHCLCLPCMLNDGFGEVSIN